MRQRGRRLPLAALIVATLVAGWNLHLLVMELTPREAIAAPAVMSPPYANGDEFIEDLSTTTVDTLTVPSNTLACEIQAQGGTVYVTHSGTDPTTSRAFQIQAGDVWMYNGSPSKLELLAGAANTDVFINYYR